MRTVIPGSGDQARAERKTMQPTVMEAGVSEVEMRVHTKWLRVSGLAGCLKMHWMQVRDTSHTRTKAWALLPRVPEIGSWAQTGWGNWEFRRTVSHLTYNSTPVNYSIDILILVGNDMHTRICGIVSNGQRLEKT